MSIKTHLILDGLQDPRLGRELSARWAAAGFENAVDVAGQCAWVARKDAKPQAAGGELTEAEVDRAAAIARGFGPEVRDRVGSVFRADNDLAALREKMVYEYKSRFATALVFGLPAIVLHYLGPRLAGGGGGRTMVYPWLFEMILVGWACLAAGWPILWQGVLSLMSLRMTGDLLTSLIVVTAFAPSAVGFFSMAVTSHPWFISSDSGGGPMFFVAMLAVMLAVLQRWLAHRAAAKLSGRAMLMLNGFGRFLGLWLIVAVVAMVFAGGAKPQAAGVGWRWGIAVAMLMPPMISLGAVNRWSPGWSMVLPVVAFGLFMWMGPEVTGLKINGVEVEIAAGFQLVMTLALAVGWRGWRDEEKTPAFRKTSTTGFGGNKNRE